MRLRDDVLHDIPLLTDDLDDLIEPVQFGRYLRALLSRCVCTMTEFPSTRRRGLRAYDALPLERAFSLTLCS
jgi:hypothetical protein